MTTPTTSLTDTEPVALQSAIVTALQATLALLLFLDVDPALVGAFQGVLALWVIVIGLLVVRRKTWNINSVRKVGAGIDPIP